MKNNTQKEIEIDIKNNINNEIKNEIINYTNNLFNNNSKNYIKYDDTINAQKLQNKTIGVNPGSIVDVQSNGKIYPNIIFTKGMIMAWYGQRYQVPENWAICDGTQGTPDLRNRFIIGSSDTMKLGQTGGKSKVTLSKGNLPKLGQSYFSCDSHSGLYHHNSNGFIKYQSSYSVAVKSGNNDDWGSDLLIDLNDGFNASPFDITNPYFSLFYIMKL